MDAVSRGAYCNGRCVQEVHTVMALCPGGAYCNGAVSRGAYCNGRCVQGCIL